MTTEEAEKISNLINSIVVWGKIVDRMVATQTIDAERFDRAVSAHNRSADELKEMGINVVKYPMFYNGEKNAA
jgi:hypothetical protein